jgi:hypothetical protein
MRHEITEMRNQGITMGGNLAAVIKTFEPIHLYRYRAVDGEARLLRELKSIEENTLWCSSFTSLNDPMEGTYSGSMNLVPHDRFKFVQSRIRDEKSALGICSFSEVHDNGPMWAYYADQFKGICIAYNLECLRSALSEQFSFVRVTYEDKPCMITQRRLSDGEVALRILSSKSNRWLHEREWRLISPYQHAVTLKCNCISRVFFGNRLSRENRFAVLKLLKKKHIEAREMALNGYEMKFEKLDTGSFTTRPTLEDEID